MLIPHKTPMHIHARVLAYFDMIRRSGSIREAARRLHVASSAVNRQLLQLEEEVGAPLFERLPKGLRLTPEGELFAQHVITVLQDERRLVSELDQMRGLKRGSISIVSVEGLNADLLPNCIERMVSLHPNIRIHVQSAGSAQTVASVTHGDADLAIGFSVAPDDALRQCALGGFRLGAVVPPTHPLAAFAQVSFSECARYPLILASSNLSLHALMKPVIAHSKLDLQVVLKTASVELAKRMAERGLGVAFQTRLGLEQDIAHERLKHVPLKAQSRLVAELGVYVRAGRALPPALEAFISILSTEIARRESQELQTG